MPYRPQLSETEQRTSVAAAATTITTTTTTTPFNSLYSRTTWVRWYEKGKTSLDLNEARDDGVLGWQWHQLDYMQTIHHSIFTRGMLFLMLRLLSQQCQSTEDDKEHVVLNDKVQAHHLPTETLEITVIQQSMKMVTLTTVQFTNDKAAYMMYSLG